MIKKSFFVTILIGILFIFITNSYAESSIGQTIQIYTRLQSFLGKPTWLLIIRDVDHNRTIPYLFNIRKGQNFWLALTYGRNYLITASRLQISTYEYSGNRFKKYIVHNFCNLESMGRIIRGDSIRIDISGYLSPNSNTYTCNVFRFPSPNFTIVPPEASES